jgi:uracil-DNA glycosylase
MPQVDLVLVIGLYAQTWHIGRRRAASLTETVRNWRAVFAASGAPRLLPLPHPSWRNTSWLKRNPWFGAELLPVLRDQVRERIGAPGATTADKSRHPGEKSSCGDA